MQLGDLKFRVDPNSVDWSFQIDTSVINTLGGQVVQLLGSTLSDLTVTGDFGQLRGNHPQVSWQLAAAFHKKIKSMMDAQTLPAKTVSQSKSVAAKSRTGILSDAGQTHKPVSLVYHDGLHNWSFKVLIKALDDNDGSGSLNITNGKFAYQYKLTLFIVQSDSDAIKKVASDFFLQRLSDGLGWTMSAFNGHATVSAVGDVIQANGGSVAALLDKVLTGGSLSAPTVAKATSTPTVGTDPTKRQAR